MLFVVISIYLFLIKVKGLNFSFFIGIVLCVILYYFGKDFDVFNLIYYSLVYFLNFLGNKLKYFFDLKREICYYIIENDF